MPFINAFNETMKDEGGYSQDPTDRGGETYKGITRKNFPGWAGWPIVDKHKPLKNGEIIYDNGLDFLVQSFYKENFWDVNQLDIIDLITPTLAEDIFDAGVNVGYGKAAKWLQSSLNLLNRNQKSYPDIKVDGGIGSGTIKALQACIKTSPPKRLLVVFNIYQGEFYKDIMEKDPTQEKYVGWFDRVEF